MPNIWLHLRQSVQVAGIDATNDMRCMRQGRPGGPHPTNLGWGGGTCGWGYKNLDMMSSIFKYNLNNMIWITCIWVTYVCLVYLVTEHTTILHDKHTFGAHIFLVCNATPRMDPLPSTPPPIHPIWISDSRWPSPGGRFVRP